MALLALMACGGDESPAPPPVGSGRGACRDRTGATYIAKFVERSGTCRVGTIESVIVATADAADLGCTGTVTLSEDGCETTFDTDCPNKAVAGARLKETGKGKWSVDGSYGTSVQTTILINPDGSTACASTFDGTYTRQ